MGESDRWAVRLFVTILAGLGFAAISAAPAAAQSAPHRLVVSHLRSLGTSPRVADLPSIHVPEIPHEIPLRHPPAVRSGPQQPSSSGGTGQTGSVQTSPGPALTPSSGLTFDGLKYNGSWPPDPNIAVGKTTTDSSGNCVGGYVVQVVNTEMAVYNKCTGAPVLKTSKGDPYPVDLSYLWVNTVCASNSGDPVVQYDRADNRWLITEIGPMTLSSNSECIALSTSGDPTGTYNLWQDPQFGTSLGDYPKFGVWPTPTNSAYLATYNLFNMITGQFEGARLCAYDRDQMYQGATSVDVACATTATTDPSFLPADLDGDTAPAKNTPGYFLDFNSFSSLKLYELTPNFGGTPSVTSSTITVDSFSEACGGGTCIPQLNTDQRLDSLGDRLMYRLAFRMLGGNGTPGTGTPTMVVDHSVAVGNSVGIRWYELQPGANGFSVIQSNTYAPDSAYRWMGSIAMDKDGDIALGYSKSSGSLYPEIDFTGRTPGMANGVMGTEVQLQKGFGAETGCPSNLSCSRWGDYTSMQVDPDDNNTFWYTNEYYTGNSYTDWATVISSFQIASGGSTPPPAPTCSLSPSPQSIWAGASAMLAWTTSLNATKFSIDNGIGSVTPVDSGSISVFPASTTTYTGTATDASSGTSGTCAATVTVGAAPTGVTATNNSDGTATVTWNGVSIATSYNIDSETGTTKHHTTTWDSTSISPVVTGVQATSYTYQVPTLGTYRYRVKACTSVSCSSWSGWSPGVKVTNKTSGGGGGGGTNGHKKH